MRCCVVSSVAFFPPAVKMPGRVSPEQAAGAERRAGDAYLRALRVPKLNRVRGAAVQFPFEQSVMMFGRFFPSCLAPWYEAGSLQSAMLAVQSDRGR